ncbi:MAG: PTS sugar transporter subunit IIA [Planctomycetes bacterium]|nr:PTS sugar transporter subunit IIA [Planctomycetota bacterium]
MIRQIVDAAALISELGAKSKDSALKELLQAAQDAGAFPANAAKALGKRLTDREAIGSTGLGNGVAVPHVKGVEVTRTSLVLARCRAGMEWQAIDGKPVHAMFMLVSPATEPEVHLKCLRWIAGLVRHADFRRFLLDAADGPAMRDLLREMSAKEPS